MKLLIDSHCHLDMILEKGVSEIEIYETLEKNSVDSFIQIAADPDSMRFTEEYLVSHPSIKMYYTIGQHPGEVNEVDWMFGLKFAGIKKNEKRFVAIGEIGLDYYYHKDTSKLQIDVFQQYLEKAVELNKPVCIHTREAHVDTLTILTEYADKLKILIHCFTGNKTEMIDYLDIGCYISFSGIVTFKNATIVQEAALACPMDRMMIETDAPFLSPVPQRGKINQPAYVRHVLEYVANLKSADMDYVSEILFQNTTHFFNL